MTHPHKSLLKDWKLWLGVLVSVGALAFFLKEFRDPNIRADTIRAFKEANYGFILLAILLNYLSIYLRGVRWRLFFRKIRRVSYNRLFGILMIGFMGNSILPFRAGEFMRAYLLGRKEKIGLTTSFATIFMERVFDLLAIVVCAAAVAGVMESIGEPIIKAYEAAQAAVDAGEIERIGERISEKDQWLYVIFTFGPKAIRLLWMVLPVFLGGSLLALYAPGFCESILGFFLKVLPHNLAEKFLHLYRQLVRGIECLRDPKALFLGLVSTIAIWGSIWISEYLVLKSFGFDDAGIGYMDALFIMTVLAAAVTIPQAPGYMGVFHIAVAASLRLLLLAKNSEAADRMIDMTPALAMMLWFVQMIPIILVGFICLRFLGLSLTEIRHDAEEVEEEMEEIEEKEDEAAGL